MTSGGENGTSGAHRWPRPWLLVALIGVLVCAINASSELIEFARAGVDRDWWEPVLWEVSSAVILVGMAPLVGRAIRRWPPTPEGLVRFGLIHLGLTIPFALIHLAFIYVTRESIYWALGEHYGFFDDGIGVTSLYEWRKDVLVYGAIASVYWLYDFARAQRAPPPTLSDARIEVRGGATSLFFAPADILMVEAAGNYVEIHAAGRTHLVRGTLAAWEERLAQHNFVRAHRSRLINRTRVRAIKATGSGDLEIELDDGRTVTGSRRYREGLEATA